MSPPQTPLKVQELTALSRRLLEDQLPQVLVQGEISNFMRAQSGHWYFSLKDDRAQVRCALFRNRNRLLKCRPENGMEVVLRGRVSLYEARGEFQLIGDYLEAAGEGALRAAFEALRARLEAEGLFDPAHKQPLPSWPRRIGVITSPRGAALRDVLSVLARRCPAIPVDIYPVTVQGDEAAPQIRQALARAVADGQCDVLLLTRGGGSSEDLWPFNDEALARDIYRCPLPLVSAVGHETDFSMSDWVADLRAPTPSAAAELLSPDQEAFQARLEQLQQRLARHQRQLLENRRQQLAQLRLRLRHPRERLQQQAQHLDRLHAQLHNAMALHLRDQNSRLRHLQKRLALVKPRERLKSLSQLLDSHQQALVRAFHQRLEQRQARLAESAHALHALSPLATLERGYAIVSAEDGCIIRDAGHVLPGTQVRARLQKGTLLCRVEDRELP